MRYLSNGDFGFPFTWPLFLSKQFYIWSYQTGALNADGVMRTPGRLLDLAVFMMYGNIAFEYFFIFSSLLIVFWSFYYFAYKFLEVKSMYARLAGALFFTLNPIFLGNLSKIGLVLAAALLPLCLVMVREVFEQQRFRYLFIWLVLLNVSLIHPFTFSANFVVSGAYLLYQAWLHRSFAYKNWHKFVLAGGAFILLNAYFLFPLASMHTVSKNVLSDTVASAPTDYTALVGVLNTGDIFTGLSLSKNVVKDYNFYNATYASLYFLGTFGFYALLISLYLRVERRMNIADKRRSALLLACFLVLVALATVTFLHVDALIRVLITLPGGWAFRSPLKWQLYIPLTLFGLFVLCMKYITSTKRRALIYAGLGLTFILMNGFLVVDIYKRLLTPRSVGTFSTLQQMDLNQQNLLLVTSSQCWPYEQDHPRTMTELNQVLGSKNVQIKSVSLADIDLVDLNAYDHILGCQGILGSLAGPNHLALTKTFARDAFQLYSTKPGLPYVSTTADVSALKSTSDLAGKHDFITQQLGQDFNFVNSPAPSGLPVTNVQDVFDGLSVNNIVNKSIATTVSLAGDSKQNLYFQKSKQTLYYSMHGSKLSIGTTKKVGYVPAPIEGNKPVSLGTSDNSKKLSVTYDDPTYEYKNLIKNPSLEQGLWQKKVGDCYNYDDTPEIAMNLTTKGKTDGRQSLELESSNHIACTGPNPVKVTPGQQYLLDFDYWSPHQNGGYSVIFNNSQDIVLPGRLPSTTSGWHTFSKIITAPQGATTMTLRLEVFPDSTGEDAGIARFDNFKFIGIPKVQDSFYLASQPKVTLQKPAKVDFVSHNPTKTTVQVHGAQTPFYLVTGESYSPQWRLELSSVGANTVVPLAGVTAVPNADHVKLNSGMNGWYVDPTTLCAKQTANCVRNADGSYDITMVMEFTPQRWMAIGAVVSGLTFVGGVGYFVYDLRQDRRRGVTYRLWR
jgi:hypothetical protein